MTGPQSSPTNAGKLALRDQLLAARRRLGVAELGAAARSLADVLLAAPEVRGAATVAGYIAIGSEPGTSPLLDRLSARGTRVLLPCLLPGGDVDWAAFEGDDALLPAPRGLLEPTGPRLGVDAVARADAVLVPGLAVSPTGLRLGRGGGSYDRVLARVPTDVFTCVLLHDGETGLDVPAEPHDQRVSAAATPSGLIRF